MTILVAILGGVPGLVLGWIAAAATTIMLGSVFDASNFEGALAMQAVFGAGPIGGIVGLVLGAWLAVRLRRRRREAE